MPTPSATGVEEKSGRTSSSPRATAETATNTARTTMRVVESSRTRTLPRLGPGRFEGEQRATPATGRPGWCETSAMIEQDPVLAAGAVVMRRRKGVGQVLLVHRPKYDDWAFPKGKLDPGESARTAAVTRGRWRRPGATDPPRPQAHRPDLRRGQRHAPDEAGPLLDRAGASATTKPSQFETNEEIGRGRLVRPRLRRGVADLRPRPRRPRRGRSRGCAAATPLSRAPPRPGHLPQAVVRRRDRARPSPPWASSRPLALVPDARGVRRASGSCPRAAGAAGPRWRPYGSAYAREIEVTDHLTESHATVPGARRRGDRVAARPGAGRRDLHAPPGAAGGVRRHRHRRAAPGAGRGRRRRTTATAGVDAPSSGSTTALSRPFCHARAPRKREQLAGSDQKPAPRPRKAGPTTRVHVTSVARTRNHHRDGDPRSPAVHRRRGVDSCRLPTFASSSRDRSRTQETRSESHFHPARSSPALASLALGLGLTACGAGNEEPDERQRRHLQSGRQPLRHPQPAAAPAPRRPPRTPGAPRFQRGLNPEVTVNYDPIGSGGGREQFIAGGVAVRRLRLLPRRTRRASRRGHRALRAARPRSRCPTTSRRSPSSTTSRASRTCSLAPETARRHLRRRDHRPGTTRPSPSRQPRRRAARRDRSPRSTASDESGTTEQLHRLPRPSRRSRTSGPYEADGVWPIEGGEGRQRHLRRRRRRSTGGDGSIGYADASQAGDLGIVASRGRRRVRRARRPEAAAADRRRSPRGSRARASTTLVFELDHTTEDGRRLPDRAGVLPRSPARRTPTRPRADLVKAFVSYVVSEDGPGTVGRERGGLRAAGRRAASAPRRRRGPSTAISAAG